LSDFFANQCAPIRFRYPPPQHIVYLPKKSHLKQDVVRNFLYTICTQNFDVYLAVPMLMFEGIC